MLITVSVAVWLCAWTLLLIGVEPVPTWFYVFAWYPTLVLIDELAARVSGRPPALRGIGRLASLLGWSAIIWLVFEVLNFRLDNWYYVFLPHHPIERWTGILLSFATVVPALLLAERLLDAFGVGRKWRTRAVLVRSSDVRLSPWLGCLMLGLSLTWPLVFFPLCWGAAWFFAEPVVYRRWPELSLFADAGRGDWGRAGRLLLGGLGIGVLWEGYNYWARGKWIYTVPLLEETRIFEIPPYGFIGFPFLALEAWALYHALCALGIALPLDHAPRSNPWRTTIAAVLAGAFAGIVLVGMDRWTISSTVPRLHELPGVTPDQVAVLTRSGVRHPFDLARPRPGVGSTDVVGLPPETLRGLRETARLVTLRGIGAVHARELETLGIRSVCDLARANPPDLWNAIHAGRRAGERRPTRAEVRVWVRAAEWECGGG